MAHGETIRTLRKSKKMSRKELAKGIVSERTLQRFENSSSRIDIVSLEGLLQKLNVQIDEYFQYQNQYQPSKKELYHREFRSKMYQLNEISAYVDLMEKEYEYTSDIFYLFMLIQSKAVAQRFSKNRNFDINKKEIKILFKYLLDTEEWGYFELAMYTNCLSLFETEYLSFNYQDVVVQFKKFNYSLKHKTALIKFLVNSILIAFEREEYLKIPVLLAQLYEESDNSDLMKGRIYWKFFSRMYQTVTKSIEVNNDACIEIFQMLEYQREAENLLDLENMILENKK